mgnify:CR=1 FL=1
MCRDLETPPLRYQRRSSLRRQRRAAQRSKMSSKRKHRVASPPPCEHEVVHSNHREITHVSEAWELNECRLRSIGSSAEYPDEDAVR